MVISKDQSLLPSDRGNYGQASKAEQHLPAQVDPDQPRAPLSSIGLAPARLPNVIEGRISQ